MKRNIPNINTPEEYNTLFGNRRFEIDRREPLRARAIMAKFNGGKFLDAACGVATHTELALAVPNSEVYAFDFADKLIESLKKKYPTVQYDVQDIRKTTYPDNNFDYIALGEVLEHMEDPNAVITELVRIMKVGGILAISTPHSSSGIVSAPKHHIWTFEVDEMKKILEPFGMAEVGVIEENYHHYIMAYLTKK